MRNSKFWFAVLPIILVAVLTVTPGFFILNKMGYFMPAPSAQVTATASADAPELVFVADYDFNPYSYLNEDGTPNGMDVEISYELANRLGMRPRIEFGTWSECKEKIKGGNADILLGLEIFVDGTSTSTLKSIPVGSDTLSIIGKDKISDAAVLSGKKVGVSFGSALMGLFKLNCEYVEFFTYSEMLEALNNGDIDYGICHASVAEVIIEKNNYDLRPSLVLMESFPTMGVRQDKPELLTKINKALEDMSADGTIATLRNKWIVTTIENRTVLDVFHNYEDYFILYAVLAIAMILGYIVAVLFFRTSIIRKKALDAVTDEKNHFSIVRDIINSAQWSFAIGPDDEITDADYSDTMTEIINIDIDKRPYAWEEILHPEDKEWVVAAFNATIKDHTGNTPYDVTYRMADKNGNYNWFRSAGKVIRNEDGTGEFFGIHINVTERVEEDMAQQKLLEDALDAEIARAREEKGYQLAILNNAYSYTRINLSQNRIIPPIIERENGQPVDYTDRFPSPLPTYEEVFAIGASRYVADEYKESYTSYHSCSNLINCYNEGNMAPEYICYIYSTKIGWHYRKYITYISKDEASEEYYGMSVAYDVTGEIEAAEKEKQYKIELEEARDNAESASKSKTKFLFNMSHDIRTPMNAILGYTDIGIRHSDDENTVKDSLTKIKTAGGHLLNLINDILEMSRIESGTLELVESPLDIREAIAGVEQMSSSLAYDKDIDFTVNVGEISNPYIYADELHVNEIIINLISNAMKYTPRGGKVSYTVNQIGNVEDGRITLRAEVRDNGIGMSDEFQEHLFETFSREKSSTVSKIEGTGIGLSIVKKIIDMAGGTITVNSKLGEGSCFAVEMPFRTMDEQAIEDYIRESRDEAMPGDDATLHGKRVLLVEDNDMNREIAMELLEEAGLVVEEAEDGKIAVDMVTGKGVDFYDFILMDIQMPVMNGYEATQAIRALPDGGRIPIIALSANAFKEDMEKSKEAGMNAHVAKPIDVKTLFDVIHSLTK